MRVVTAQAMQTVIQRRKPKLIKGDYQITDEMIAEAMAIDEKKGKASETYKVAGEFERGEFKPCREFEPGSIRDGFICFEE